MENNDPFPCVQHEVNEIIILHVHRLVWCIAGLFLSRNERFHTIFSVQFMCSFVEKSTRSAMTELDTGNRPSLIEVY